MILEAIICSTVSYQDIKPIEVDMSMLRTIADYCLYCTIEEFERKVCRCLSEVCEQPSNPDEGTIRSIGISVTNSRIVLKGKLRYPTGYP